MLWILSSCVPLFLQPGAYFASSVRMLRVYTSTNSNTCVHTILIQLHVFVCLFVSTPTNSIICIHTLFSFMFLFVCLFVSTPTNSNTCVHTLFSFMFLFVCLCLLPRILILVFIHYSASCFYLFVCECFSHLQGKNNQSKSRAIYRQEWNTKTNWYVHNYICHLNFWSRLWKFKVADTWPWVGPFCWPVFM